MRNKIHKRAKFNNGAQRQSRVKSKYDVVKRKVNENGDTVSLVIQETKGIVCIPKLKFAPDAILVDLICSDTTLRFANVGATFGSFRYSMNSIHTPLVGGSLAVPGYTVWGTMYSEYRVVKCSISIDVTNLETFPLEVILCPTTSDIGANYALLGELFANPYASQSTISSTGGLDRITLEGSYDIGEFYGNSAAYIADREFAAEVGNNPSFQFYLNVGVAGTSNMTANHGIFYRSAITYKVLYTARNPLTN